VTREDIIHKLEQSNLEIGRIIDDRSFHRIPLAAYVQEYNHNQLIISALKKQVALKVQTSCNPYYFTCSGCGHDFMGLSKFCKECGQKLDRPEKEFWEQ
jgi:hypothetical protein